MLQPKSKLPWKFHWDGNSTIISNIEDKIISEFEWYEDTKYTLQACNNFPEAIILLKMAKLVIQELDSQNGLTNDVINKIEEFLKNLNSE